MQEMPKIKAETNFFLSRALKRQTQDRKYFDPKITADLSQKYRQSLGLGIKGKLSITDALDNFEKGRVTNSRDLQGTPITGGTLGDVLKRAENDNKDKDKLAIKDMLDPIFSPEESFQAAFTSFNTRVNSINEKAKKTPPEIEPLLLARTLEEDKNNMVKSMKAQFESEINKFNDLAKDETFKAAVKMHLGVSNSQYDSFTNSIEVEIKKKQSAQLEAFETAMNEQTIALRRQAQSEQTRIAYIAMLTQKNPKVKAFIETRVGAYNYKQNSEKALLSIKLEELADAELLTTLSGRKIKYNKETESYEYKFPSKWNLIYNLRRENMAQNDMRSIAEAVKASGHDSIIMTVEHSNPKNAKEMARMAYQAARMAGFPEDKIKIKVSSNKNSKEASVAELFDTHSSWKKQIERKADELEIRRGDPKAEDRDKQLHMKKEVTAFREGLEQTETTPVANTNTTISNRV